jgi:hypothetical protein
MTNEELLVKAKSLAGEERRIAAQIIDLLREIDSRQIWVELKYGSLQEFCEQELGYSSGAAARRIAALRVVKDVPEVKELLIQGQVSLETLQMAQIQFRKEKPSAEEKREVLGSIVGKSKREAMEILKPEKRYSLVLDEEEYALLQELKARVGSSNLKVVLKKALESVSPAKRESRQSTETRAIGRPLKQAVFRRDQGRCAYPSCPETKHLQIDHITPYALGGQTTLSNLRLLCPTHNRKEAIHVFGADRMKPYLRR